jgi:hypothetical protein
MAICYWCGKEVLDGEGAREHVIPRTLLQDVSDDVSAFILPAENAHATCNKALGDNYEHDFCQIIFHYSVDDPRAAKHVTSKIRNLKRRIHYAWNQFGKMRKVSNGVIIGLDAKDKESFETVIKKILKGLYFKREGKFLDADDRYAIKIVWNTLNLEKDRFSANQAKLFLETLNNIPFSGNSVFEYRFAKAVDSVDTSLWELLFYHRFPVYLFLIHEKDKSSFNNLEMLEGGL